MSQDIREKIANNVKKYRTAKNFKREEMSLLLNFDNSYISKLERKSINITIDKLAKIADFLDVEVVELLK